MIDGAILAVIPPVLATVLTWIVANKRAHIKQTQVVTNAQVLAIEQIRIAEEKMRQEVWKELEKVRDENSNLKREIIDAKRLIEEAKNKLDISENLTHSLTNQLDASSKLVAAYKLQLGDK